MKMNRYQRQALTTAIPITPELIKRAGELNKELVSDLQALMQILNRLDSYKSYIFYGKQKTVDLGQPPSFTVEEEDDQWKLNALHAILGLLTECGELLEAIRHREDGTSTTARLRVNVLEEAGDALWFVSLLTSSVGLPLKDVAEYNLLKLKFRYSTEVIQREANQKR